MIYLVEAIGTNLYKIGKADDPDKRFASLKTMSPIPLRLVCRIATHTDYESEGYLHRAFMRRRIHGEWFRLSDIEVQWISSISIMSVGVCGLPTKRLIYNCKASHYCHECDKIEYQWTDSSGELHRCRAIYGDQFHCLKPKKGNVRIVGRWEDSLCNKMGVVALNAHRDNPHNDRLEKRSVLV